MGFYSWTLLISIILCAIFLFLFKSSYDSRTKQYDRETGTYNFTYNEEDKLVAPLWAYIVFGASLLIPVFNVIIMCALLIMLFISYYDEDAYLNIPCLSWLTEEY